jgi:hypothetical protein
MRLLFSGEGPTDLGQEVPTSDGKKFIPGPMAWVVDKLLELRLGYSLLELHESGAESVNFVHKANLIAYGKPGQPGKPLLSGLKHGKGQAFHARSAQCFGLMAKAEEPPVVAVLFRDSDGTNSTPRQEWREKFESMVRGFALAGFDTGVPMVPRPKSEAWLLCGLKPQPYQHCDALEEAPGNDGSPAALKTRLKNLHGQEPSADEQAAWVRDGVIDPTQIDMPSFTAFRDALDAAVGTALART